MSQATTQTGVKLVTLLVHKYKTCDVYVWKWKFTQKWKNCHHLLTFMSLQTCLYIYLFISIYLICNTVKKSYDIIKKLKQLFSIW